VDRDGGLTRIGEEKDSQAVGEPVLGDALDGRHLDGLARRRCRGCGLRASLGGRAAFGRRRGGLGKGVDGEQEAEQREAALTLRSHWESSKNGGVEAPGRSRAQRILTSPDSSTGIPTTPRKHIRNAVSDRTSGGVDDAP